MPDKSTGSRVAPFNNGLHSFAAIVDRNDDGQCTASVQKAFRDGSYGRAPCRCTFGRETLTLDTGDSFDADAIAPSHRASDITGRFDNHTNTST